MSESPRVRLVHGAASDVGLVRDANEDSFLVRPPVFAVADGMGGHDRGVVASALAVDAALRAAQQRVAAYDAEQRTAGARRFGSGTTVVAAVLTAHEGVPVWLVSNLGDSRAYGFDGTVMVPLSTDHSLVQELVEAGSITAEQAREHPERHVVTRALGGAGDVRADHVMAGLDVARRLLLCSDGVTDLVDDDGLAQVLAQFPGPQDAADALVDAASAAGGTDNATAVVVDVVGWDGRGDAPSAATAPG